MSKRRLFTKRQITPSHSPMSSQPELKDMPSSKWCLSIRDTPLSKFEDCLLNNNLSALIISGFPTEIDLAKAWENIMLEYSESLGNSEYSLYRNLYKEAEILRLNIEMIKILIATLRLKYSKKFADELNGMLYLTCKFNERDIKSYYAELDKCERRIAGLQLNLDLKLLDFEELRKKIEGQDNEKIDNNYFTSMLITLSRVLSLGYRLSKEIMMAEYCEYFRQAAKESEAMMKERHKVPRY